MNYVGTLGQEFHVRLQDNIIKAYRRHALIGPAPGYWQSVQNSRKHSVNRILANMQSKNSFVAGLFVIALCALVVGGMNLYENVDFRLHKQHAVMELADPDEEVVQYSDVLSTRTVDVKYTSEAGVLFVPQKSVSDTIARRLAAGEAIPVIYLTNNPKRLFYRNQRPPNRWAWLVTGSVALAIAIYALRLRKREIADQ